MNTPKTIVHIKFDPLPGAPEVEVGCDQDDMCIRAIADTKTTKCVLVEIANGEWFTTIQLPPAVAQQLRSELALALAKFQNTHEIKQAL